MTKSRFDTEDIKISCYRNVILKLQQKTSSLTLLTSVRQPPVVTRLHLHVIPSVSSKSFPARLFLLSPFANPPYTNTMTLFKQVDSVITQSYLGSTYFKNSGESKILSLTIISKLIQ